MQLNEVSVLTRDVVGMSRFYRQILRLPTDVPDADNRTHQFILTQGVGLSVYDDGAPSHTAGQNLCLAFTVDDVDEECARLTALGVPITQPPSTQPWGARNLIFLDPDGNAIYFRSFPS